MRSMQLLEQLGALTRAIARQNQYLSHAREALDASKEALQDALDGEGVEMGDDEGGEESEAAKEQSAGLGGASAGQSRAVLSVTDATKAVEKQRKKSRSTVNVVAGEVVRLVKEACGKLVAAVRAGEVVFTPPQAAGGVPGDSASDANVLTDGPGTPVAAEPISPASRLREEAQGDREGSTAPRTSATHATSQAPGLLSSGAGTAGPASKKRKGSGSGDAPRVAPSKRYDPEALRREVQALVAEAGRELLRPLSEDERERMLPASWLVPPPLRAQAEAVCNSCLELAELHQLPKTLISVPHTPQFVKEKVKSDEGIQELVGATLSASPSPAAPRPLLHASLSLRSNGTTEGSNAVGLSCSLPFAA